MIAAICFIACSNNDDINEMMTGATTGSASGSGGRIISWVQLWAGGPKFAVNNISKNMVPYSYVVDEEEEEEEEEDPEEDPEEEERLLGFSWGSNWRAPSKDEMEELVLAANGDKKAKVSCKYEKRELEWGFTFTGKETGYTNNSIFFPTLTSNNDKGTIGTAKYWTTTTTEDKQKVWCMNLEYTGGKYSGYWSMENKIMMFLLRPVLNND